MFLRAAFAWNLERVSKSTDTQPREPLLIRTTLLPHVSVVRSLTGTPRLCDTCPAIEFGEKFLNYNCEHVPHYGTPRKSRLEV